MEEEANLSYLVIPLNALFIYLFIYSVYDECFNIAGLLIHLLLLVI